MDEDRAHGPGFRAVDEFFRSQPDSELAWIVAPALWNQVMLTDRPTPLPSRASVATRLRRRFHSVQLRRRRSWRADALEVAGDSLFLHATENQARTLKPIIDCAGEKAVSVAVSARALSLDREFRAAERMAARFLAQLRRAKVPVGNEAMFRYQFLVGARARASLSDLLEHQRPKALVTATNQSAEARVLLRHARELGVPSLYVPHAPMLRSERLRDLPFDRAALRGGRETSWYVDRGVPDDRVDAVGNPGLAPEPQVVEMSPDGPVVLALSPDEPAIVNRIIEATREAAGDNVVLAPHPRQSPDDLARALPTGWRVASGRTYDLLRTGPRLVVQYSSGVALEAMLLGLPVLELSLDKRRPAYPFLETDLVRRVTTVDGLRDVIADLLAAPPAEAERHEFREWGRSWCQAAGQEAAHGAWRMIRDAQDHQGHRAWLWDAWSELW